MLGYRDPMTYKKLGTVEGLALTNHVLIIERLIKERQNAKVHQYIKELMNGKDPRKSEWFDGSI